MDIVYDTHEKLSALIAANDNESAEKLIKERFGQLPEETQARILVAMLTEALEQESAEADTIASLQREGITAIKALEALKESLPPEEPIT